MFHARHNIRSKVLRTSSVCQKSVSDIQTPPPSKKPLKTQLSLASKFPKLVSPQVASSIQQTKLSIDQTLSYFQLKMAYTKYLQQTKLKYLHKIQQLENQINSLKLTQKHNDNKLHLQDIVQQLTFKLEKEQNETQRLYHICFESNKKIHNLERVWGEAVRERDKYQRQYEELYKRYRMEAANPQKLVSLPYAILAFLREEEGDSELRRFCLERGDVRNSAGFFGELNRYLEKGKQREDYKSHRPGENFS